MELSANLGKLLLRLTLGGLMLLHGLGKMHAVPAGIMDRLANAGFPSALGYLVYVGEYLAIGFLLFFRRRFDVLRIFAFSFLLVNLLGFATYFIYPAAPPWYVSAFGLGPARMDVHSAAAAASRFDALLGTHFFDEMYGRGVDVYGAFPSLHVAYPLLAAWAAFRIPELRWVRVPAVCFFLLMCVSAVYLQHHYVIDVLLGIAYAVATVALVALARRIHLRSLSRGDARRSTALPAGP